MAQSTCPKCGGHSFELVEKSAPSNDFRYAFRLLFLIFNKLIRLLPLHSQPSVCAMSLHTSPQPALY